MKPESLVCAITPIAALTENFDTTALFGRSSLPPNLSPIDRYIANSNKLSTIYLKAGAQKIYTPELGSAILLGYVSAVESYMRGIIRGLIQVDEYAGELVASKQLSYAAALHHKKDMLPEALLEEISFSSVANICTTLKDFCGVSGMSPGNPPPELAPVFKKFTHICQLRHCCVHRFGLLGTENALKLGIDGHKEHLEQPLALTVAALDEISSILEKLVSSINTYVYKNVLERTFVNTKSQTEKAEDIQYKREWNLEFEDDEDRFRKYYDLFARTQVEPCSESLWENYAVFQSWAKTRAAAVAKMRAYKFANAAKPKGVASNAPAGDPAKPITT